MIIWIIKYSHIKWIFVLHLRIVPLLVLASIFLYLTTSVLETLQISFEWQNKLWFNWLAMTEHCRSDTFGYSFSTVISDSRTSAGNQSIPDFTFQANCDPISVKHLLVAIKFWFHGLPFHVRTEAYISALVITIFLDLRTFLTHSKIYSCYDSM